MYQIIDYLLGERHIDHLGVRVAHPDECFLGGRVGAEEYNYTCRTSTRTLLCKCGGLIKSKILGGSELKA